MLNIKKWTLKNQITLMMGAMGTLTLLCSIFIVSLYSQQIIDNHQDSLNELVNQEVSTLHKKNEELLQDFGLSIQHGDEFRTAFSEKNIEKIDELINDEFNQYYITAEVISVSKIFVYDLNYNLIAPSMLKSEFKNNGVVCPDVIARAVKRKGASRIKMMDSLCEYDGHVFESTIIPVGSLKVKGYIHILSDPIFYLKKVEKNLNMPLRIIDIENHLSYETPNWESLINEDTLLLDYYVNDVAGNNFYTMSILRDIKTLNQQSRSIRNLIIVSVLLVTVIAVFIFLFIFDKVMVKPLSALTKQLTRITEDKTQLGNTLPLEGSQEIMHLTSCFNNLNNKLSDLYNSLEYIAFTDELTELPNRSKLQEILSFHASLNCRDGVPFVLFMMDLNRFKSVNDTLGHHAGDLLLREVGNRLSTVVRKSDFITLVTPQDSTLFNADVIARLGGDEFAAILPAMENIEDAIFVADKMVKAMNEPFIIQGNTLNVGVSIGIAACPLHGRNPKLLMQHADVAMYQAKNNSQNYSVYDPVIDQNRIELLTLEDDLRDAIKQDKLNLVYQPKIDIKKNKIIGVEALIRWTHDKHGFIPPDRFIPIAEQSTLINDVSRWVIYTAMQQKKVWNDKNINLTMAINISARNLSCSAIVSYLNSQITELGIDAKDVYLEITETALMTDHAHSMTALRELNDMGFRLSIDDFGTGYSSLSYLKQLPVHEIKIDRSFVMEMEKDENDTIIVQSTIDLAHNMGLSVTAEGVEDLATLKQLNNMSSDYAQGYYMCRPINSDELEQWLEESEWGINYTLKK